jgi:serine/threonine protein kinase
MDGSSRIAHITRYSRGTECYRAPELIVGTDYTNKVDLWAIGCILYDLVFWRKPFDSDYAARRYAESGKEFEVPLEPNSKISERKQTEFITRIIRELLKADGSERPSARSLYEQFVSLKLGGSADEVVSTIAPAVTSASNLEILRSNFEQAPSGTRSVASENLLSQSQLLADGAYPDTDPMSILPEPTVRTELEPLFGPTASSTLGKSPVNVEYI